MVLVLVMVGFGNGIGELGAWVLDGHVKLLAGLFWSGGVSGRVDSGWVG